MSSKTKSLKGSLEALLPGKAADPQGQLLAVARDLLAGLDTPTSLGLAICLKYGELEQVVRKRINPLDYNDELSFRLDYQAASFLAKAPLKIQGIDPMATAIKSFLEAEESCRRTNHRLRLYRDRPYTIGPFMHSVLHGATKIISSTLGDVDPYELLSNCRFGPGADSSTSGNRTSSYDKLLTTPEVTRDAVPLACALVNQTHGLQCAFGRDPEFGPQREFAEHDFKYVRGNRITFVPKTAVTHRTIAIEPHLNIYMQLGVGTMIRSRLKRRGLDLNSQEGNQFLAKKGSIDGRLCTIDLSSASDTMARELVRELLPDPWFRLLDALRSKVGTLRVNGGTDAVVRYEKFSSMGNGFTFELETLIFWALARSVLDLMGESRYDSEGLPRMRVYGDDIIVPTAVFSHLADVLEWCGFSLNTKKSFNSGYFRESCGKDYFAGTPVRPYFQKELPSEVQTLFRMANGIRRAASRSCAGNGCDNRYKLAWDRTIRGIPKPFRHFHQPYSTGVTSDENMADFLTASDYGGSNKASVLPTGEETTSWFWYARGSTRRAWETGLGRRRHKETPSAEENWLIGSCSTDDSVALISNLDEAMGSKYYTFTWNKYLFLSKHNTMAVRAEPRRFTWDTSRCNVFGVLLYETRNGRETAVGPQSTNRGSGKQHVVWLHWEQWRDIGPWV